VRASRTGSIVEAQDDFVRDLLALRRHLSAATGLDERAAAARPKRKAQHWTDPRLGVFAGVEVLRRGDVALKGRTSASALDLTGGKNNASVPAFCAKRTDGTPK
jgi:hypothetical protein